LEVGIAVHFYAPGTAIVGVFELIQEEEATSLSLIASVASVFTAENI
jgi:hypothetical protein